MSSRLFFATLALSVMAQASTVDISATVSGCSQCNGTTNVVTGTFLTNIFSPVQLTLGAGTYMVTNAATTGMYSAWNFQGAPSSANWVWSFVMAADNGTNTQGTVVLDDYIGGDASYPNGIYATPALAAGATGVSTFSDLTTSPTVLAASSTAMFTDYFTLASTTTVDFLIDDFDLGDNGGGVALKITQISGVPEPSSFVLLGAALLVLYSARTLWTNWTAIDPSPTAAATRFMLPERTSPTAKIPGRLVSSK